MASFLNRLVNRVENSVGIHRPAPVQQPKQTPAQKLHQALVQHQQQTQARKPTPKAPTFKAFTPLSQQKPAPQPAQNKPGFLAGVGNRLQAVAAQVNPADNGRTYNSVRQKGANFTPATQVQVPQAPKPAGSVIHQLTHNGITNAAGNMVVKPFVLNPADTLANSLKIIAAAKTHNVQAGNNAAAKLKQDIHSSLPYGLANQGAKTVAGFIVDPAQENIAELRGNKSAQADAEARKIQDLNATPFGQLFDPVQHSLAKRQVSRDVKGTKAQKEAALKANLEAAGLNPDANALEQLKTSGLSALQLAGMSKGLPARTATEAEAAKVADTVPKTVPGEVPVKQVITKTPVKGSKVVTPASAVEKPRGFVESVNESPEVSPTVAGRTAGTYKVRNTKQLAQKAETFAGGNLHKATEAVSHSLAKKKGTLSDEEVANAIAVAKRHDANNNHAQATDIYENLGEHLTKQGQAIQAASLLDHRTPEGIRYQITKTFKKAGVTPSKEVNDAIDAKMQDIKNTKVGTVERTLATKQLQKIVADNIPSNIADKAVAFWKAGLLSGVRTQSGNILSNETFSILHNASNPLAAGLDKLISLKTGERTKTLTGRGLIKGTATGTKQAGKYLKTGIDERSPLQNKFETRQVNFKNKALNTYVNGIFKLMGAADRPHYYRQLQSSLADLGIADAKNKGLKGAEARTHIQEFMDNPPDKAFQTATDEAEKAVLGNETMASRAIARLRQAAGDAESPIGKAVAEASINILMPFTKVPSAFISRVLDYTPAGAIKEIASQISRKQFDQRSLVTALSEATTGTGIMYLGKALADNNLLSGNYPTDPKEQARWTADGIQPNSVKIGNEWVSLNYLGPAGLLFGMGKRISDGQKSGEGFVGQQVGAYAGLPKDLSEQSFLQGVNNSLQAVNEPGRYAKNFVNSQVGSLVPTISNDVATATDSAQRQVNNVKDAVKSRIPGLRESLNKKQDVYGNDLNRKTSAVGTLINPFRPSDSITNRVKKEVDRLHNADPNNSDLSVTPTPVDKVIKVEGTPVKLTDGQRYALQKQVGQATQSNWNKLIQTPEYNAMTDADKAAALNGLRTDSTTLATRGYVVKNNLGVYNKEATKAVQLLSEGDLSKYLKAKSAETSVSKTKTKTTKPKKAKTAKAKKGKKAKVIAVKVPRGLHLKAVTGLTANNKRAKLVLKRQTPVRLAAKRQTLVKIK